MISYTEDRVCEHEPRCSDRIMCRMFDMMLLPVEDDKKEEKMSLSFDYSKYQTRRDALDRALSFSAAEQVSVTSVVDRAEKFHEFLMKGQGDGYGA